MGTRAALLARLAAGLAAPWVVGDVAAAKQKRRKRKRCRRRTRPCAGAGRCCGRAGSVGCASYAGKSECEAEFGGPVCCGRAGAPCLGAEGPNECLCCGALACVAQPGGFACTEVAP